VIATLGNFATKLLSGNPTGITRVRGTPQIRELGGRTVFLLPLFHPAAALRTPSLAETLRSDMATLPDLLRRDPAPMAPASGDRPVAEPAQPEPAADQLGLFGA
jgi:uracil-DNA glycosylase